jgi:hypothetical protein
MMNIARRRRENQTIGHDDRTRRGRKKWKEQGLKRNKSNSAQCADY